MTPDEFYKKYLGRKVDADGAHKNQCVDAFITFCRENNVPYFNTVTGWAGGLWTHRQDQYRKYFDLIYKKENCKNGDWMIFTNPEHVAMCYNGLMFSQNQGGKNEAFDLRKISGTFLGAYRLKTNVTSNTKSGGDNVTLQEAYKTIAAEVKKGRYGNGHENRMKKIYEEIRKEVNKK